MRAAALAFPSTPHDGPVRRSRRAEALAARIGRCSTAGRRWVALALLGGAAAFSGPALAQPDGKAGGSSPSQAQYILDRERCNDPSQYQDKSACLREAAAARDARAADEARASAAAGDRDRDEEFQRNQALRCEPLPADQRTDCLNRAKGQGMSEGSVGAGGILRESVTRELGTQPAIVPVEIK